MTLDNKLGLTDSLELAKMEEKISKTRAKELLKSGFWTIKKLALMRLWPLFMGSCLKKSMTSLVIFGQSISPKGIFALRLSCIWLLPWKISTECLSRPLIKLSKSMWS